jgi:hypothetical protein
MWKVFWVIVFSIVGVGWIARAPVTVHSEGKAGGARVQARLAGRLVYDRVLPESDVDRTVLWLGRGVLGGGLVAGAGVGLLLVAVGSLAFQRGWLPSWLLLPEWLPVALLAGFFCFVLGAAGRTNTRDNMDGTQTVTVHRYGLQVYQTTGPTGTLNWVHDAFLYGLGGAAALLGGLVALLLWRRFATPASPRKVSGAA